jgi:hypothetical protein
MRKGQSGCVEDADFRGAGQKAWGRTAQRPSVDLLMRKFSDFSSFLDFVNAHGTGFILRGA